VARPKHNVSVNGNKKKREKRENVFICYCGKKYITNSGLWKHKCKQNCYLKTETTEKLEEKQNIESETNLIMMLVKQNSELLEVIKNGTHNTINNTTNKTFNLQLFLNETCKEAMNIQDFIDNVEIQLNDLLTIGKIGYVEGISQIINSNLKALDISKRPIHCSDKKREILYIKDKNKWEKDERKIKIKNLIQEISNKNISFLSDIKIDRQFNNNNNNNNNNINKLKIDKNYNNILLETLGGINYGDSEENIIKNISKNVFIEKN
jgi:hypothetical protein